MYKMLKIQNERCMTPDKRQECGTQVQKEIIVKYDLCQVCRQEVLGET